MPAFVAFLVLLQIAACDSMQQWVVQISDQLSAQERAAIEDQLGVRLSFAVSQGTFLVTSDSDLRSLFRGTTRSMRGLIDVRPRTPLVSIEKMIESEETPEVRRDSPRSHGKDGYEVLWVTLLPRLVWPERPLAGEFEEHWRGTLFSKWKSELLAVSSDKLRVTIPHGVAVDEIANWFSGRPETLLVESKGNYELRAKYARNVLVSGSKMSLSNLNNNPLWDAGITGSGQLIGIADTGVDLDNCLFFDIALQPPLNSINTLVRKIIGIYNYSGSSCGKAVGVQCGDIFDDDGHGTHAAGCAVGDVYAPGVAQAARDSVQAYAGIAKGAQLVFTDISVGSTFSPPDDTFNNLFPDPYNAGVRIYSISWGSSSFRYTSTSSEFDTFMWNKKDFLIVVAAGNDYSGVGAPGTSKNALVVGATQNKYESYLDTPVLNANSIICGTLRPSGISEPTCCSISNCTINDCCPWFPECCRTYRQQSGFSEVNIAPFSPRGPTYVQASPVAPRFKPDVVAPGENIVSGYSDKKFYGYGRTNAQCSPPSPSGNIFSSSSALIGQAGTSYATALIAGSAALVRQYFTQGFYPSRSASQSDSFLPSAALVKATIIAAAQPTAATGFNVRRQGLTLEYVTFQSSIPNGQSRVLACFSAAGIWYSSITTAATIGEFSLAYGTATSLVCTEAFFSSTTFALISYSQNCSIPILAVSDGRKVTCNIGTTTFLVSCSLCRAAKGIRGNLNGFQGFGLPALATALPLSDSTFSLAVYDTYQFSVAATEFQFSVYKVTASIDRPFVVVLAWTDAPGETLINDLDLSVSIDDGPWMLGNGEVRGGTLADSTNTIERVMITQLRSATKVTIKVRARAITTGPQPFSLVIVGNFSTSNSGLLAYQIVLLAVLIPLFVIVVLIIFLWFFLRRAPTPPPPPPPPAPAPAPPPEPKWIPSPPVYVPSPPAVVPTGQTNGPLPARFISRVATVPPTETNFGSFKSSSPYNSPDYYHPVSPRPVVESPTRLFTTSSPRPVNNSSYLSPVRSQSPPRVPIFDSSVPPSRSPVPFTSYSSPPRLSPAPFSPQDYDDIGVC